MRKVSVEVLEDAAHPEGGYAVLVLHGVSSLPDGVTFRLKPVEARGSADLATGEAWPRGEQRPRAIRQTASGIELLIGPDIVESPALLPGTLGVIELPAAGLRGEFLWPSIRPTARSRRRNLSVVKPSNSAHAPAKPKAEPRTAAVSAAVDKAVGSEALAALSPRVLREASSGGIAGSTDLAARADVPVTALDHATPATASVAEAIGTNVVQLNVTRETSAASQAREGNGGNDLAAQVGPPDAAVRPLHERSARDQLSRHALAAALAFVVIGGAGYLLLRDRSAEEIATARAVQEQAIASSRSIRAQTSAQPASAPPAHAEPRGETIPVEITTRTALTQPEQSEPSAQRIEAAPSPVEPVAPATPVAATPPPAEVTLRMRGGGFQIAGELKGFDGTKYVIETRSAGTLTMDASRFECIGDACARPVAAILPLSERPSPAKPDVFRIEGAAALAGEFVPQLIRDYAASIGATASELPREPGHAGSRFRIADVRGAELATIEVLPASSASALTSLERGAAAIALVDRPAVAEPETRSAPPQRTPRSARPQTTPQPVPLPSEIVLGLDGIAAVTAPQNPTASLSIDNLAKVLAGQITDWFELGQAPGPIAVYLPPDGTGSLETFVRQVLRPRSLEITRAARRLPSEADAADAVAKDPRGVALVSLAAQRSARAISLEQSCGLIVRPTTFAVKTGEYPFVRRLSLQLAPQLSQPSARGLVRIAQSGEVQNALGAARIVDASIASLPIEDQSERMAWAANAPASAFDPAELRQMLVDLEGATRLSTTFRFVAGTNDLDARSKREIQRLAATLREPELAGRRIILAGFTDTGGKFQANLSASQRRASQVRSALLGAAGPGLDQRLLMAKGYGPLAPVGCNGTPEGTRLNRRVEVWVAGGRDLRLPR